MHLPQGEGEEQEEEEAGHEDDHDEGCTRREQQREEEEDEDEGDQRCAQPEGEEAVKMMLQSPYPASRCDPCLRFEIAFCCIGYYDHKRF